MNKPKRKSLTFVNAIILLCLMMCLIITAYEIYAYNRIESPIMAAELAILMSAWGGELLLIVIRQVLGRRQEEEEPEPTPPTPPTPQPRPRTRSKKAEG